MTNIFSNGYTALLQSEVRIDINVPKAEILGTDGAIDIQKSGTRKEELPGWMYGSWNDNQYQLIITFPQQMGSSGSVHKVTTVELLRSVAGYKTEVTVTP